MFFRGWKRERERERKRAYRASPGTRLETLSRPERKEARTARRRGRRRGNTPSIESDASKSASSTAALREEKINA